MNVETYCQQQRITRREFASRIETTEQNLSAILAGSRQWGVELIARCIVATKGQVGFIDLRPDLFPKDMPRRVFARGGSAKENAARS